MDRAQLADFLRHRREATPPGDVGLLKGPRRRAAGLRREEVADLAGMSVDYYSRIEQQRGPQPSSAMSTSPHDAQDNPWPDACTNRVTVAFADGGKESVTGRYSG